MYIHIKTISGFLVSLLPLLVEWTAMQRHLIYIYLYTNIFMEVDCWHRRTPHECLQLSNSAHLLESSHFIIPYNILPEPIEVALQVKLLFSRRLIFSSRVFEATKFCLQKMLCTKSKTRWLFCGVLRTPTFQLSRAGGLELYE